jgi:hypothetical protein
MADPAPAIGLVTHHAYLWWSEARAGREEGRKNRPCVIVHLRVNEHRELETYICPVTHTPPELPEKAMELPRATKARLGLDAGRKRTARKAETRPPLIARPPVDVVECCCLTATRTTVLLNWPGKEF